MARVRPQPLRFDFDAPRSDAPEPQAPEPDIPASGGPGSDGATGDLAPPARARVGVSSGSRPGEPPDGSGVSTVSPPASDPVARASDRALTVAELYDRLRGAIAQAFPAELWVVGEIRSHRERKGHHYLEVADPARDRARAGQQIEIVCWAREWQRIALELAKAGASLDEGRVVRVRGRAGVWEGGGKLRLTMSAIDVEALVGAIAVARQKLLAALAAEDLLEANRRRPLPLVPLRIGLVTSEGSEAHRDFAGRLERSRYRFDVHVERSLVQGPQAPWQIAAALRRLARRQVDLAVVVRGGGGRGDLACFDDEQVARAVAAAPFPVWVGIGHTGDRSVADEVANGSFITPTACGDAVVARVDAYWARIGALAAQIAGRTGGGLSAAAERLARERRSLGRGISHQLNRRADELATRSGRASQVAQRGLASNADALHVASSALARCGRDATLVPGQQLRRCRDVLRAYDPQRQLERGWSLTHDAGGRLVRSVDDLTPGDVVRTRVADGELQALVQTVTALRPAGAPGAPGEPVEEVEEVEEVDL